jgi:hypothetical protein
MIKFSEYDGTLRQDYHFDDDGSMVINYIQDTNVNLDFAKKARNNDDRNLWRKEEFKHYASIPAVIYIEMLKKGIDMKDSKALVKEIELNYPYLKTTEMNLR